MDRHDLLKLNRNRATTFTKLQRMNRIAKGRRPKSYSVGMGLQYTGKISRGPNLVKSTIGRLANYIRGQLRREERLK